MDSLSHVANHSRVTFINRIPVSWGGFSIVKAEMMLFEAAYAHGGYRYYHLLSGLDLPVKSQDYIHGFFQRHDGENFIKEAVYSDTSRVPMRYDQYHVLQDSLIGKKRNIWKYVDFASCYMQKALGVRRFRGRVMKTNSQWVSVTDELVGYLVSQSRKILHDYRWTYCCDEVFLLSTIWGTGFIDTISPLGSLRFIEWKQFSKHDFSPRPLTMQDFATLSAPNVLFARKFTYPESEELMAALPTDR